jgi:CRISPR/Cas system-associated exonuclease Cas4 (RecB family)
MGRRSVSQVTTLEKCGEQYRLEKIAKAPSRPAAWFHQGSAFHVALEMYEANFRQQSPAEIMQVFYDEYDTLIGESLLVHPDYRDWMTGGRTKGEDDIARRREKGAKQVADYISYSENAPERVWEYMPEEAAVELPFTLHLGDVEIIGYIDLLNIWPDGQVTVRDAKTGSKRPDSAFQLGLYALGVEEVFGFKPAYGDFYMAKDGKPDPFVDLSVWGDRERLTRIFNNADQRIIQGLFNPNPGDYCRVCGVQPFCDISGSRAAEFPAHKIEESMNG